MRKLLIWLHKWLGIVSGIVIMIICLSGAFLSFERELMPLSIGKKYYASVVTDQSLPLDRINGRIREQFPERDVTTMTIAENPQRNMIVRFADEPQTDVYVNPYTGSIEGTFNYGDSFFGVMRRIHRYLLLDKTGKVITGSCSILFSLILLSGLWIFLTHRKGSVAGLFRIRWKKGGMALLYDLHVVPGIIAMLFLLLMSLTGPFWSFDWYNKAIYNIFGMNTSQVSRSKGAPEKVKVKELTPEQFEMIRHSVDRITPFSEGWKEVEVTLPTMKKDEYSLSVKPYRVLHGRQSDLYTYSAQEGKLLKSALFKDKTFKDNFRIWIFAIHSGSWGGLTTKILYFLAVLVGFSLPLTGYLFWWKKRRKSYRNL